MGGFCPVTVADDLDDLRGPTTRGRDRLPRDLEVLGQLALATAVGLTAGIVPVAVAVAKIPSFGLYVPWVRLGEVLAGCAAAALLALLVAARHLSPRERSVGATG